MRALLIAALVAGAVQMANQTRAANWLGDPESGLSMNEAVQWRWEDWNAPAVNWLTGGK